MNDSQGRTINYLRLSVTDRCNLRCQYCMPSDGIDQVSCKDILRFEDFLRIVEAATTLGVRKVRITGGEPLVRKGVIGFIQQVAQTAGIDEVTLTTNGLLLCGQAHALKSAGAQRLNVSIDSLQEENYKAITRGGDLAKVFRGLAEAEAVGLKIKLNMVVMRGVNDHEIIPFASLSQEKDWSIRFIEYMPTIREPDWKEKIVTSRDILTQLQNRFDLQPLSSGRLSGPAKPYRIAGAPGTIGIISPMSDHFCGSCNRIRITSTGFAKSCLLDQGAVDLRPDLAAPGIECMQKTLQRVIQSKPPRHQLDKDLDPSTAFSMSKIGG